MYKQPTRPDLDVRDIGLLQKIPDMHLCLRIAIPKDGIGSSKLQPDAHPASYNVPYIHLGGLPQPAGGLVGIPKPPPPPPIQEDEVDPENKNEEYECAGMNVFVHYIKNYEPAGFVRVRTSLYEGPALIRQNNGQACYWSTKMIGPEEAVYPDSENYEYLKQMGVFVFSENLHGKKDVVIPVSDDVTWIRDLYGMQLEHELRNDVLLLVELLVKENPYKGGNYRSLQA